MTPDGQQDLDITAERLAFDRVEALCRQIAQEAPPIWRWGDDCGGYVFLTLGQACFDAGLFGKEREATAWRPRIRDRVLELAQRDGWECMYCGTPLGWGHPSVSVPNVEHMVPVVRGGSDDLDNTCLSCGPCNTRKGQLTAEEFLAKMAEKYVEEATS